MLYRVMASGLGILTAIAMTGVSLILLQASQFARPPTVIACICIGVIYDWRTDEGGFFRPPPLHLLRPRVHAIAPPNIVCEPDPVDGHDPCNDAREPGKA
jgi:hypothetical protein